MKCAKKTVYIREYVKKIALSDIILTKKKMVR